MHKILLSFFLSISLILQTCHDASRTKINEEYDRRMGITKINGEMISQAQEFKSRNMANAIYDAQEAILQLPTNLSATERAFQSYKIEMSRNTYLMSIYHNCAWHKQHNPLFASTYHSFCPLPNQCNQAIFIAIHNEALEHKDATAKIIQDIWNSGAKNKQALCNIQNCYKASLHSV